MAILRERLRLEVPANDAARGVIPVADDSATRCSTAALLMAAVGEQSSASASERGLAAVYVDPRGVIPLVHHVLWNSAFPVSNIAVYFSGVAGQAERTRHLRDVPDVPEE